MRIKIILFLALVIPLIFAYKAFFLPGQLVWGDAPYFSRETLKSLVDLLPAWTNRGHNFGGPMDFYWAWPITLLFGLGHKLFGLENAALIRIFFYFPSIILAAIGSWWYAKKRGLILVGQFFTSLVYSLNTYILLLIDGGQVGVALAYGLFPFGEYLLGLIFLSIADFRLAIIYLLFQLLVNIKCWREVLKRGLILVGIHAYWWYPMLKLGAGSLSTSVSGLQLTSLLNSLLLYQPHWPLNEFGKTIQPAFYFALVPILILANKKWRQILLFLIFAFLAKGESAPFGGFYTYILNRIPYITAFRDSTKFFVPLLLLAGTLIGTMVQKHKSISIFVYLYLIFLVHPALLGQMRGVLSGRTETEMKVSSGSARVLWFDERHPLGYESKDLPAIDAKHLVENRIFASYNIGNDAYNFLSQDKFKTYKWLELLGIGDMAFPGNTRISEKSKQDPRIWETKLNPMPRMFGISTLTAVIGADDISTPSATPAIYLEDGKFDPRELLEVASESLSLLFNHKEKIDLQMTFLQRFFVTPGKSAWAIGKPEDYLNWKYQLLMRGLDFKDFTYNKSIAYSTQKGEQIKFDLKVPVGNYYLAVRRLKQGRLEWVVSKQDSQFVFTNETGLDVINVVAIVPEEDWVKAVRDTESLMANHATITKLSPLQTNKIDFRPINSNTYEVEPDGKTGWIIFTDSYHPKWQITRNAEKRQSLPVYSAVNGFYLGKWNTVPTKIFFEGQSDVRWGAYFSIITILLLIIWYLYRYDEKMSNL